MIEREEKLNLILIRMFHRQCHYSLDTDSYDLIVKERRQIEQTIGQKKSFLMKCSIR